MLDFIQRQTDWYLEKDINLLLCRREMIKYWPRDRVVRIDASLLSTAEMIFAFANHFKN